MASFETLQNFPWRLEPLKNPLLQVGDAGEEVGFELEHRGKERQTFRLVG